MLPRFIFVALVLTTLCACLPNPNVVRSPIGKSKVHFCIGDSYMNVTENEFQAECEMRPFEFEAFIYASKGGTIYLGDDLSRSANHIKYSYLSSNYVLEAELESRNDNYLSRLDKVKVSGFIKGPYYSPDVVIKKMITLEHTAKEMARVVKLKAEFVNLPPTLEEFAAKQYMDALEQDSASYKSYVEAEMKAIESKSISVSVDENFTPFSALYIYSLSNGEKLYCEKGLRGDRMFFECKD